MDWTNDERQKKFREQMKEAGKKQRTFFLSENGMDAIKKFKENAGLPSLNHALEELLISIYKEA